MAKLFDPPRLPKTPKGFTRKLTLHLNFGGGKGSGLYEVKSPTGAATPIGWQYDSSKGGLTGFTLPDVEDRVFTWAELRVEWPKFRKRRKK